MVGVASLPLSCSSFSASIQAASTRCLCYRLDARQLFAFGSAAPKSLRLYIQIVSFVFACISKVISSTVSSLLPHRAWEIL